MAIKPVVPKRQFKIPKAQAMNILTVVSAILEAVVKAVVELFTTVVVVAAPGILITTEIVMYRTVVLAQYHHITGHTWQP